MSGEDLRQRLDRARETLTGKARFRSTYLSLNLGQVEILIEALNRPEVRQTCASTSNYPAMAERALRLIQRNRISESEAIEGITHLVDCAGLEHATKAVEDDDVVPF